MSNECVIQHKNKQYTETEFKNYIDEEVKKEYLLEPKLINDSQATELGKNINRIPNLTPSQQYKVIDFIYNEIASEIDFESHTPVTIDALKVKIKALFDVTIGKQKMEYQQMINQLESIKSNDNRVTEQINKLNSVINKINSVENNFELFTSLAINKVMKYTGIKDTIVSLEKEIDFDESDIEGEESDEQTYTNDKDDISNKGERYDASALEENGKKTSSYRLKRFMSSLKDKLPNGQDKKGFLGLPVYTSFDLVYNTCAGLLSDTNNDFDTFLAKLKENETNYPFLKSLIAKLESPNTSQQIKNEFVTQMSKHNLEMEFVMYGYNKKTGNWSLRKYQTNSNAIIKGIKSNWESNFKGGHLVIQNGLTINKNRAKFLLNKKDERLKVEGTEIKGNIFNEFISKNKKEGNTYFTEFVKDKPDTISVRPSLIEKLNTTDTYFYNSNNGIYEIKKLSNSEISVQLKPSNKITRNDFVELIKDFGIDLNDKAISSIENKEYSVWENKNKITVTLDMIADRLYKHLNDYTNKDNDIKIEEQDIIKEVFNDSLINKLCYLQSQYSLGNFTNSFRDAGKSIYGYTASKFITDRLNDMKQNDVVINQLKSVSYSKHSIWLEHWDSIKDYTKVTHLGLTSLKEIGKKVFGKSGITDLADSDHELCKAGLFQDDDKVKINVKTKQGIVGRLATFFSPTASDKTTQTLVRTLAFDLSTDVFLANSKVKPVTINLDENGEEKIEVNSAILDLLYEQTIKPELTRISSYLDNFNEEKGTDIKGYDKGALLFLTMPFMNNMKIDGVSIINYIKANNNLETDKIIDIISDIENKLKNEIHNELNNLVSQLIKEKIEVYTKSGFYKADDKGNFSINNFDKVYLDKFKNNNTEYEKLVNIAMDFEVNNLIFNSNAFMNFIGDPALFYKVSKDTLATNDYNKISEEVFINVGKRLAAQIAPGNKIANSKNDDYIQIFLADRTSASEGNKEYKIKLLGNDEAKKYEFIDGTDAQEYTTWREHLHVLKQMGRITDTFDSITTNEIETVYKILDKEIPDSELTTEQIELINKVMQPIKPVYTGQIHEPHNDVMRTMYIKSSSFPLVPHLTKGLEIDKLRLLLEDTEKKSGKHVRASYESANKVGSISKPLNVWNKETGKFDIDKDLEINDDFMNSYTKLLPRDNFRIQQDVPYKESKNKITLGTQSMKLLFGDGILDIQESIFDVPNELFGNSNKLTSSELHTLYNNTFLDMLNSKKKQLYDELGIDTNTHLPIKGKELEATQKLQDILKAEATNRGYSQQDIEGLELNADGKFVIPLWMSANSNKYENLLQAIVNNRMIKLKISGNSYVLGSEEGFRVSENIDELSELDKSKIIFTSAWHGNLKPSGKDKHGNFRKAQILVPSKIRDNQGNLIDLFEKNEDGTHIYITIEKETGKYRLNENKIPLDIISQTTFRIPSSKHGSLAEAEIAGILPISVGDLMIATKDFTKQMGADYDIDKQNCYAYTTYKTKDGKLEIVSEKHRERLLKQGKTDTQINDIINNNKIIALHKSILSNSDDRVQQKIQATLSTDYAEEQALMIDGINTNNKKYFSPLSSEYQKSKMFLGASGKVGTGSYSLDVVFHSLLQQSVLKGSDIRLTEVKDKVIVNKGFNFGNENTGIISDGKLGTINTIKPRKNGLLVNAFSRTISEVNAERQNIAVDNEKLQVMGKVNLNDLTIGVDKVFNLLGIDRDENGNCLPFLFLSQPIIKEYVFKIKNGKSNVAGYNKNLEEEVINELLEKYKSSNHVDLNENTIGEMLSGTRLLQNLESEVDDRTQIASLMRFLEMKKYADQITKVQTTINIDSKGLGKSIFDNIERRNVISSIYDNNAISNVSDLIGNFIVKDTISTIDIQSKIEEGYIDMGEVLIKPTTVSGAFSVNAISTAYNLWNKHFPYDSNLFNDITKQIFKVLEMDNQSETKKIELKQNIFRELKKYLNSNEQLNLYNNKIEAERNRLFIDNTNNTSLSKYLQEIRKINNPVIEEFIKSNKLIQRLQTDINYKMSNMSVISFNNAKGEEFDEDYMNNALAELLESNNPLPDYNGDTNYTTRKFAQDLINYTIVSGGIQEVLQFSKYIPVSFLKITDYADKMNKINWNSNFPKLDKHVIGKFAVQYFQHNPNRVSKIDNDFINDNSINVKKDKNGIISTFTIDSEKIDTPKTLYSVYTPDIKFGNKYMLYKTDDGVNYYRIPTVGFSPHLNEYNMQANSIVFNSIISENIIEKPIATPINPVTNINTDNMNNIANNQGFNLNQPIINLIQDIGNLNITYFSSLAKQLENHIPQNTKIVLVDSDKFRGMYNLKEKTIYISKSYFNKASKYDLAKTILHESIHAITSEYINKYIVDGKLVDNAPQSLKDIANLFSQVKEKLGKDVVDNIIKKHNNKEALTPEEKQVHYAAYNLHEFITVAMVETEFQKRMQDVPTANGSNLFKDFINALLNILSDLGIDAKPNSITSQSINKIFEFMDDIKNDITKDDILNGIVLKTLEPNMINNNNNSITFEPLNLSDLELNCK